MVKNGETRVQARVTAIESPGSEGDKWKRTKYVMKTEDNEMENEEPLMTTEELHVSMENFREDKKAKMKNKESDIKTRKLEFCKEKFSEVKAKLKRNKSPFMHLN
ncbi:hypothetical protein HPP92_008277 [Vanilla planifolia]|uniref:Uncharacterized protein n=1 Tax=Vanilla planifolia TaxID=51239 RepID=A0A835RHD9_VANPL|nr:hypothetical protein HPP92_008476 [Vanilla planifolia]KAG0486182.1 hypothetical protein HPP92_008277 [Vanilla planifolia]